MKEKRKNSHLRGSKPFNHLTSKPSQCHAHAASSVLRLLCSDSLLELRDALLQRSSLRKLLPQSVIDNLIWD